MLPACGSECKGQQNGSKNNISNKKFDLVRPTNFQLLWQIKGKTTNYSIFNVHATFCYRRLLTLLAPGAKTPLICVVKFTCNLFQLFRNVICSKLFGKQNLNMIAFPKFMNLCSRKIF